MRSPVGLSRTLAIAAAAALSASLVAGCGGPDPEPAAEKLAAGLSARDLSDVPLDDSAAPDDLTRITGGMDDLKPTVTVEGVEEDGDTATATLSHAWTLGPDQTWTYETEATLTKKDDAWTVRWDPAVVVPDLAAGQRIRVRTLEPDRADILGQDDSVLVTERPVKRVGFDKTAVPAAQQDRAARRLAQVVGIDPAAFAKKVAAAGPKAWVEAIVLRADQPASSGDPELVAGGRVVSDTLPLAPTRTFAAAILGSVGEATKELIDDSDGRLAAGDTTGISGLQKRYDESLRGTDGHVVELVSDGEAQGDAADEGDEGDGGEGDGGESAEIATTPLFESKATNGTPLRTTLDARLQTLGEKVLAGVKPASALVAIRPSDGAVLAAATGPGANGQAIATTGQYAPGSTFKIATALAALRAGVTPSTTTPCPATTVVDGKSFKNYDDYPSSAQGRIPFAEAFAQSCNTAMIGLRSKVAQTDLASAAASLGMGVDKDLGFPSYFGAVPDEAGSTEHAASMIGQGKVLASPFTMANVVASVAAGRTVVPVLLPDHDAPKVDSTLTSGEARQLRSLMRRVVTDGSGRALAGLGGNVGAKTGTAEYGSPVRTHAWMVAYDGDLAVAVFVETGKSGSQTAGPLLQRFLRSAS